jgi:hypothetical protein
MKDPKKMSEVVEKIVIDGKLFLGKDETKLLIKYIKAHEDYFIQSGKQIELLKELIRE